MPITELVNDRLRVRNLKIDKDVNGKRYIQWIFQEADAFVLCFSRYGGIDPQTLNLSEADLVSLSKGGGKEILNSDGDTVLCRLQGVRKEQVEGSSAFRDFTIKPPEYVQVWSLLAHRITGEVTLYAPPVDEQWCHAPLEYNVSVVKSAGMATLRVSVDEADKKSSVYQDGDLCDIVNGCLPIPIPKNWLNNDIKFKIEESSQILVIPKEDVERDYECEKITIT